MSVAAYLCVLVVAPGIAVAAELGNGRLPISLDADESDYDGNTNMLMFKGLRISQGAVGIEADEGRATKLDFKNSVWKFFGNVVIDVDLTHIECESADLKFVDHELRLATIQGTPATFRQGAQDDVDATQAEAGFLEYDFGKGQVVFEKEALITQGGSHISSHRLVYSIEEQIIIARSESEGDRNVKITIIPPEDDAATGENDNEQ